VTLKYFNVKNGLTTGNITLNSGNSNITANNYSGTGVILTGNITSGNANLGNLATANYFSGDGSLLTSITAGNVTGQVGNALVAGTVYTNAQPNITSVGTLTSLTVSGNLSFTGANAYFSNIANVKIPGGSANYVIVTDGSGNLSWAAQSGGGGGGTPGGSNTQLQFNDGGSFGGTSNVTYDKTTNTLSVTGNLAVSGGNVSLGDISNIHITGGANGQVITTDGSGNLSFVSAGSTTYSTVFVDAFTGNGVQTSFTLSTSPTSINTTQVNYNGVIVLRSDYSITGNTLSFTNAPANNSSIEVTTTNLVSGGAGSFVVRTYTGNGSTVNYSVTNGATVSSVLVTLDGVLQTPTADYTITGTTLTFTTAPGDSVAIQIRELAVVQSTSDVTTGKAIAMAIVFGF